MQCMVVCGWVLAALTISVVGAPVLEYAPTPAGPWTADTRSTVEETAPNEWQVVTALQVDAASAFYRLSAPEASFGVGNAYPAYYVSWVDAQHFIAALNAHIVATGQAPLTVRLPSEVEWEYACRGGGQTRFSFGESLDVNDDCEDDGQRRQYMWYCGTNDPRGTKPVGLKLPNAFGLYDMHGNVYEWCEDWYHSTYDKAPSDGSPWVSPVDSVRVGRGGCWSVDARRCRSAYRDYDRPTARGCNVGFRLAASEESSPHMNLN